MKGKILVFLIFLYFCQWSNAATISVTSFDGPGCNLVAAVEMANTNDDTGSACAGSYVGALGDDAILLLGDQDYVATQAFDNHDQSSLALPYIYGGELSIVGGNSNFLTTIRRNTSSIEEFGLAEIQSGKLTLKKVKVSGFKKTALKNSGGELSLIDSELSDNFGGYGGAVYSSSKLYITRTLFYRNQALVNSADLVASGGCLLYNDRSPNDELIIEDSTFYGCFTNGIGGAINAELRYGGTLKIRNSTVSANWGRWTGGVHVASLGLGGSIETVNSIFSGNYSWSGVHDLSVQQG